MRSLRFARELKTVNRISMSTRKLVGKSLYCSKIDSNPSIMVLTAGVTDSFASLEMPSRLPMPNGLDEPAPRNSILVCDFDKNINYT
jgi:hypothetical protein